MLLPCILLSWSITAHFFKISKSAKRTALCYTSSKKSSLAHFGGKNPTDRAKQGIKHVLLVDRKGAPLQVKIAAANIHDSKLLPPILKHIRASKKILILAANSAFDVKNLISS